MAVLPDFALLARRAFKDYASQLEGLKLRCQWVTAFNSTVWLPLISDKSPAVTPPGHLLPEHLLDINFPLWRIWASWKPDLNKIKLLDGLDGAKRGVLPDLLALEGPDFIGGKHTTLREGLVAGYGGIKPIVRFRSLILEVSTSKKEDLAETIERVSDALEVACKGSESAFRLFVQLTIARPITKEALEVLEAVSKIPDTPNFPINDAVLQIYLSQPKIGGRHISALSHLLPALDNPRGEDLCKVMLKPWLIHGIEKCIRDCQAAVRTHIDTGLAWTHLAKEFHAFYVIVKDSATCLPFLDTSVRVQLDILPSKDILEAVIDIYRVAGGEKVIEVGPGAVLKDSLEAFCIDRLLQRNFITYAHQKTVDAILQVWQGTKCSERRLLALFAAKSIGGTDFVLRCRCITQIPGLSSEFIKELLAIIQESKTRPEPSCVKFTKFLARTPQIEAVECWRELLYKMIERTSATLVEYTLHHFKAYEWLQWMLELNTIFADTITNSKIPAPPALQSSLHLWAQQLSEFIPTITRLEEALGDNHPAVHCILKGRNASEVSDCVRALISTNPKGLDACQRIIDSDEDKDVPKDMTITDKSAIKAMAFLLGLEMHEDKVPDEKLATAMKYYEDVEAEILEEAARLEGIQRALKAQDPLGTALFLQSIGVQDTSALEEELEALPAGVIDAVERQGHNEVEISFPLTSFTELQRNAMGSGTAKTLLVHLFLDYTGDMPATFCVHLDNEPDREETRTDHAPWVCLEGSKEPIDPVCHGRSTALTWQMNRILHRHLRTSTIAIAPLHEFIKKRLQDMAHCCIICGITHNARHTRLRRSTPCTLWACAHIWNNVPLEVRIPELRTDPFAIDMLLTGVYAAAMS
ncbi:uncharacterized protein BDR25DRAFT_188015, partial [Lindgomyces ingoldianus]